ncbi:uncharacterized protein LOC136764367 [Amia ocellicauda]|uniref:uncharacterized protein LOC136764367 n=1 Tax=Amia ocellicauda TaxID=2972642 RepID=UPI003463B9F2
MSDKCTGMCQKALLYSLVYFISIIVHCRTIQVATGQAFVLGTEGGSALLPVVYTLSEEAPPFLHITWQFGSTTVILKTIRFTEGQASEDPSKTYIPLPKYQGRVSVFSHNASLLIQNLSLWDSGTYTFTVKNSNTAITKVLSVNLTVLPDIGNHNPYGDLELNSTDLTSCQGSLFFHSTAGLAITLRLISLGISFALLSFIYFMAKRTCNTEEDFF